MLQASSSGEWHNKFYRSILSTPYLFPFPISCSVLISLLNANSSLNLQPDSHERKIPFSSLLVIKKVFQSKIHSTETLTLQAVKKFLLILNAPFSVLSSSCYALEENMPLSFTMAVGKIPMIVRQPSDQSLRLGLSPRGISQRKYNESFPPPIPESLPGQVEFYLGARSIITTIQQGAERQCAITEAARQNRKLWLLRSFEERMDGVADEYAEEEDETTEWWMLEEVLYGSDVTYGSDEVKIRYEDLVHEGMPLKPDIRYCITLPLHNKTRISCDVPCDGESDSENGNNQSTRQEDSDSEGDTSSDEKSDSNLKEAANSVAVPDGIITNVDGHLKIHIETVHEGKKINDNGKGIACVPNELVVKILSNLGIRDISVCKRVNRTWKELIDESHLQARSFCLDCPPPGLYSPPKAVERYHSSIRNWLTGFSDKGKELAERLDQLLMNKYFPEELFFSVAKVLAGTKVFLCQNIRTIRHADSVNNASFSPDGYHLVTASNDNTAKIWRLVDGQWQEKITIRHACRVNTVRFSPDGYHLVTISYYGIATIWGLADGQWQEEASIQHNSWVLIASFSPDGYYLVTASYDNTVQIWGFVDGQWQEKATIQHADWVHSASFSPDGNCVVTASHDNTAKIWELVDGQWQEKAIIKHTDWVNSPSFSPYGNHLVTASDNTAKIWGLVDGQWQEKNIIQHAYRVDRASFSPDGNHLVTVSRDRTVKIWGGGDGQWQEKAAIQHTSRVVSASFSPDGNHLVTVSHDRTVKIWGGVDGQWQEKAALQHTGRVVSASFSSDGNHLVTVSSDHIAKIWGFVDGQWQEKATIHADHVNSASFSPDGYHLVTVSDFNAANIWALKSCHSLF